MSSSLSIAAQIPAFFFVLLAAFLVSCTPFKKDSLTPAEIARMEGSVYFTGDRTLIPLEKSRETVFDKLIAAAASVADPFPEHISYPLHGTVFPPDIAPPEFRWKGPASKADIWLIETAFKDGSRLYAFTASPPLPPMNIDSACLSPTSPLPEAYRGGHWMPSPQVWGAIKKGSLEQSAELTIYGFNSKNLGERASRGKTVFSTSRDSVGAPIFYRDVPLMPSRNQTGQVMPLSPLAIQLISWRLRDISRPESRVVLKSMPTCGNCHSFSDDGKWLGMDIDGPQGDKGAYTVKALSKRMRIENNDLISWNHDFKEKSRGRKTIGFLSRISPNGDYVLSTVNEEVYVTNYMDHRFLQVFYPTRGILAWYSRKEDRIQVLPGADDSAYVHCDPVWTPDGKTVIFARARARDAFSRGQKIPRAANGLEETQIQYDLCQMPFNEGRGGTPVPVAGASENGMSNNFPKVSPDGRFIVFVKCRNGQLMRPDSRLWIVPIGGGTAREMVCNTSRMNSWHSFSPNGRWMVFSSKANTYYTQMFLTHIDENGMDTPPVLIANSTADNRAVNIPEFVNIPYDSLEEIQVPAVKHHQFLRNADRYFYNEKFQEAVAELEKALLAAGDDIKFKSDVLVNLGGLSQDLEKSISYLEEAIRLDPGYETAHYNLGIKQEKKGLTAEAARSFEKTLEINPNSHMAMLQLSMIYMVPGKTRPADLKRARRFAEEANRVTQYHSIPAMQILAAAYSESGMFREAVETAEQAGQLAREQGNAAKVQEAGREAERYRRGIPYSRKP